MDKYLKCFKELHELKDDNEASHVTQDYLYRKFIKDVASNKFKTIEEVIEMAKLMKKNVVKLDTNRWYA